MGALIWRNWHFPVPRLGRPFLVCTPSARTRDRRQQEDRGCMPQRPLAHRYATQHIRGAARTVRRHARSLLLCERARNRWRITTLTLVSLDMSDVVDIILVIVVALAPGTSKSSLALLIFSGLIADGEENDTTEFKEVKSKSSRFDFLPADDQLINSFPQ